MNILHTVQEYYPSSGGMQEVVKQLSEKLVAKGHSVTVATRADATRRESIHNGVHIISFDISGNAVNGYIGAQSEITRYQSLLQNSEFDVVVNFAAQGWTTDSALQCIDTIPAKKVFVPTGFSALYDPLYKEYFEKMKGWLAKYDMNVFLSNNYRDIDFARKNNIKNIVVIPNGASSDEFAEEISEKTKNIIKEKLGISKDAFVILHVGNHTSVKGHKEVINIFKRAQIKNACLILVGKPLKFGHGCSLQCLLRTSIYSLSPSQKKVHKQIKLVQLSRPDVVTLYKTADIFLFPSNIECSPIVLFEAMASHTPFLTTDVGNSKEIIEWGKGGMLLPTSKDSSGYSHAQIKESAILLENMFKNSALRTKLSDAGYESWKNKFTWEHIAEEYEKLYTSLIHTPHNDNN